MQTALLTVGDTGVFLQPLCVRVRLSVTGIGHFTVLVDGSASVYVPGEHEIESNGDYHDQVDQEQDRHPVEPHRGLHLPGETI